MKKQLLAPLALGAMWLGTSTVALAVPSTDVQDFSNNTASEYFVDSDANKYSAPYYRNMSQDWGWTHNGIAGTGFSSIKLEISAFDVDYDPSVWGEWDTIYVYDGAGWVGLGNLAGASDIWAFTTFDLTGYAWAETQVNAGLQVKMDIDSQDTGSWLVTLGKATLSVDGGSQTCVPTPGVPCTPVPVPASLALVALGLFGLGLTRRRVGK